MNKQPNSADAAPLAPSRPVALIRRVAGPIWQLVGVAAVLEVTGRKSGAPHRVSLIPVKLDGKMYLLAFGGITEWARNLRASGRGELRRKGRTQSFTAIEVDGDERDRVIERYLRGAGPIKKDFYRRPIAGDHPTFRLEPIQ
jgi:deazaflavin-dependent oxidoreductase (nitroreductase family)